MMKPRELIEIRYKGGCFLTLHDRRIYNKLLRNAHGPKLGIPGSTFSIHLAQLKDGHAGNERVSESLNRLQRTIVEFENRGRTANVQLLGYTDMDDPQREKGILQYRIDQDLCHVFSECMVFAQLEMDVMQVFTSRYSYALYEAIALRARLTHKFSEVISLDELRDQFLGVHPGKHKEFKALKRNALDVAVAEVNTLANFNLQYQPIKKGRKVVGVQFFWKLKDETGLREQYQELEKRLPPQLELFSFD